MTQPELMRQIATAMEQDPDGWWRGFEVNFTGNAQDYAWFAARDKKNLALYVVDDSVHVRPRPRTYTLHVEDMPEPLREPPEMGFVYWLASIGKDAGVLPLTWCGDDNDHERLRAGLCYPNKSTASAAIKKLKHAMGGGA